MRVDYRTVQPQLYQEMRQFQESVDKAGIEPALAEMVRLRASQINGCAFCVDLHWRAARSHGVAEDRLSLVSAWREAACFTSRERAALEWCETVTKVADNGASDAAYAVLVAVFDENDIVALTWIVAAINTWNRVAVPMGRKGGRPIAAI
ncbi:MAG TPA: carboxymuconolactone decarboxylase family protein [Clostridia bacterium]|nr:carboxymuconolactone decarboxylase family protein [Clostridia bacterium]